VVRLASEYQGVIRGKEKRDILILRKSFEFAS